MVYGLRNWSWILKHGCLYISVVDPWTTWAWTAWIHYHVDFFFFSNEYSVCMFVFRVFKGKICVGLEITIHGINRTRVWVLILFFSFRPWGVIYQFLCFWGRDSSRWIFDCAGISASMLLTLMLSKDQLYKFRC